MTDSNGWDILETLQRQEPNLLEMAWCELNTFGKTAIWRYEVERFLLWQRFRKAWTLWLIMSFEDILVLAWEAGLM